MIAGHFTLWVKSQTGINWLASKALPELGIALPQLVFSSNSIFIQRTCLGMSNISRFARIYLNPAKKCLPRVLSAFFYPKIYWKGGFKTYNPLESPKNDFSTDLSSIFWYVGMFTLCTIQIH